MFFLKLYLLPKDDIQLPVNLSQSHEVESFPEELIVQKEMLYVVDQTYVAEIFHNVFRFLEFIVFYFLRPLFVPFPLFSQLDAWLHDEQSMRFMFVFLSIIRYLEGIVDLQRHI